MDHVFWGDPKFSWDKLAKLKLAPPHKPDLEMKDLKMKASAKKLRTISMFNAARKKQQQQKIAQKQLNVTRAKTTEQAE